jgi:hypothetical protein
MGSVSGKESDDYIHKLLVQVRKYNSMIVENKFISYDQIIILQSEVILFFELFEFDYLKEKKMLKYEFEIFNVLLMKKNNSK